MSLSPHAQQACERYFGGHVAMFTSYRDSCRERFAADALAGDKALTRRDWPEFKLLVHSLKTVLLMLGHDQASQMAARLEVWCREGRTDSVQVHWTDLRSALVELSNG